MIKKLKISNYLQKTIGSPAPTTLLRNIGQISNNNSTTTTLVTLTVANTSNNNNVINNQGLLSTAVNNSGKFYKGFFLAYV